MNEWKVIKQEVVKVENNGFVEISLKEPPKGDDILIAISKGWIRDDGQKLYKANILFSKENKDEIIKALENIDKLE